MLDNKKQLFHTDKWILRYIDSEVFFLLMFLQYLFIFAVTVKPFSTFFAISEVTVFFCLFVCLFVFFDLAYFISLLRSQLKNYARKHLFTSTYYVHYLSTWWKCLQTIPYPSTYVSCITFFIRNFNGAFTSHKFWSEPYSHDCCLQTEWN